MRNVTLFHVWVSCNYVTLILLFVIRLSITLFSVKLVENAEVEDIVWLGAEILNHNIQPRKNRHFFLLDLVLNKAWLGIFSELGPGNPDIWCYNCLRYKASIVVRQSRFVGFTHFVICSLIHSENNFDAMYERSFIQCMLHVLLAHNHSINILFNKSCSILTLSVQRVI